MTITSHIHIGLSAWQASHSYGVLGVRVSNGGNAYQLVATGTSASSGGPIGFGPSIVDNTCSWKFLSSIDFSNFLAWSSALPSILTQPIIGMIWNDGVLTTTAGVPFLSLTGHATDAINNITLTCASGESFRSTLSGQSTPLTYNTANGVSFQLPSGVSGGINYINITDSFVTLNGLQFQDPLATSACSIIGVSNASSVTISNCIIDGFAQSNAQLVEFNNSPGARVENNLFIDRQTGNGFNATLSINGDGSGITNNTIVNLTGNTNGSAIDFGGAADCYVRNTAIFGYVTPLSAGPATADHCCFSATSPGSGGIDIGNNLYGLLSSTQFVNTANDFRLKNEADCIDIGVTDLMDIEAGDDIAGSHRPYGGAWDAGCWEYVGVGQVPLSLATDPPSSNTLLLADPYVVGTVSGVSFPTITNTAITINWTAPAAPAATVINADMFVPSNNTINGRNTLFTVTGSGSAGVTNHAQGVSAFNFPGKVTNVTGTVSGTSVTLNWVTGGTGELSAAGTLLQANGWQSRVSFLPLTATGTIASKNGASAAGSILTLRSIISLNAFALASARVQLPSLRAAVAMGQQDLAYTGGSKPFVRAFTTVFGNAGAGLPLAELSATAALAVTNVANAGASFEILSGGGTAKAAYPALGANTILALLANGFLRFPLNQFFTLANIGVLGAVGVVNQSNKWSGNNLIEVLTPTINAQQINLASATNTVTITPVATVTQFNLASGGGLIFAINSPSSASVTTANTVNTIAYSAIGTIAQNNLATGSSTLEALTPGSIFYPELAADLGLLLRIDGNPSLFLKADVSPLNIILEDLASATNKIDLAVISSAFLSNGASLASTIAALSSSSNAVLQDQASTTTQVNYTVLAVINQNPTLGVSNFDITIVSTATQTDVARGGLAFNLAPVVSLGQSNAVHVTATLEALRAAAASGQSNGASLTANIDLTPNITALNSVHASAALTISALSIVSSAVQSDVAHAAVTIPITAVASLGQNNTASAVVVMPFTPRAVGVVNQFDRASGVANIDIVATASTRVAFVASATNNVDLTVSATAFRGTPAAGRATCMALSASAVSQVFGALVSAPSVSVEIIFIAAGAQQRSPANARANFNITIEPGAKMFVTPPGYVEGDNVIYWSE